MTVSCIDISHHQGSGIDFELVRESGVVAMIHKASEGTSMVDDMRASNIIAASKENIVCCTYHWISPGSDPVEQMKHYLNTVQPVRGERLVIDYEQEGCTIGQLKEAVQYLMDQKRDFQITVYSGHLLKEQIGGARDEFLAKNTDLWLAQYNDDPDEITWPDETYATWTLWQYSETGKIPGIKDEYVDLNQFNGSDTELVRWMAPRGRRPPAPQPEEEGVKVEISVPSGTEVTVIVNGEEWT